MAKRYFWRFRVLGRGPFPVDMLRHDRCCPDRSDDVLSMQSEGRDSVRSVQLVSHLASPNVGRWSSFGWTVDWVHRQELS